MKTDIKHIIEIVGMLAIIASLIFVGVQLQQDRDIAETDLLAVDQELELVFAQLIQEDPDIWQRGLKNEQLTSEELVVFDLMAYTLFRMRANLSRRNIVFDGTTIGSGGSEDARSYAFFIYEHPGLRQWFNKLVESRALVDRAYGQSDQIRFYPATISELLKQLDEAQPQTTIKRYYPY